MSEGDELKSVLEDMGVPFACEEGICGTCVIEVIEGGENLTGRTEEEEDFLGDVDNERLGCQC
ncbi:ferredoxin, partial [Candidatus Aerophobetes bacterium]